MNLGLHVAPHRIERPGQIRKLPMPFDHDGRFDIARRQSSRRFEQSRLFADQLLLYRTVELGPNGPRRHDRNRQFFAQNVQNGPITLLQAARRTISFEVQYAQEFVANDQGFGDHRILCSGDAFLHDRGSLRSHLVDNVGMIRKFVRGDLFFARFSSGHQFQIRIGSRLHHEKQCFLNRQKPHDFIKPHSGMLSPFEDLRRSETQFENSRILTRSLLRRHDPAHHDEPERKRKQKHAQMARGCVCSSNQAQGRGRVRNGHARRNEKTNSKNARIQVAAHHSNDRPHGDDGNGDRRQSLKQHQGLQRPDETQNHGQRRRSEIHRVRPA